MKRMNLSIAIGLALLCCIWAVPECVAQEFTFLKIVTSPRAAGMGQCAINLVSEESGGYNPGALGLFHLDKKLAFFIPIRSIYAPGLRNGISPKSFGFSLGDTFAINPAGGDNEGTFSVALAYSRFKMEWPSRFVTDETGIIITTEHSYSKSNNFSFSMGFDYRVRLGLGLTYKSAEDGTTYDSRLEGYRTRAGAFDFGVIAEIPFMKLLSRQSNKAKENLWFDLVPSIAYVDANNGKHPKTDGETSPHPLAHASRLGFSVLATANKAGERLVSLRLSSEQENDLTRTNSDISKIGMEFGFWEILFLRAGNVHSRGSYSFNTMGAGLDLGVLLSRFYIRNHFPQDGKWYYGALRNINLKLDFSRYNSSNDSALDNSEFINISLSL